MSTPSDSPPPKPPQGRFRTDTTSEVTLDDDFFMEILGRLMENVPETVIRGALPHFQWKWAHLGSTLFRAGDPGDALFLLASGRLEAFVTAPNGKEQIVGEVHPGECVGEMAVLTGDVRTASVRVVRDSLVVWIGADAFRALSREHPVITSKLLALMMHRLRQSYAPTSRTAGCRTVALIAFAPGIDLPGIARRLADAAKPYGRCVLVDSVGPEERSLTEKIGALEALNDLIVLVAPMDDARVANRLARRADAVYLFVDATLDAAESEHEIAAFAGIDRKALDTTLVIVHPATTPTPTGTRRWLDARPVRRHMHLRTDSRSDERRMARMLMGASVALVLGGGGARGFAHLGVFRWLQESGIDADITCGTSMGSIMAAGIAMDLTPSELRERALTINRGRPFADFTFPLLSAIRGRRFDRLLARALGPGDIEDLWKPFFCVSSNLTRATLHVHRRGALRDAVRASMSLPGVMPPVVLDGELLVDGGVVNNFPVDIVKKDYPCRTIGVSVSVHEEVPFRERRFPGFWRYVYDKFIRRRTDYPVPNLLEVISETTTLASYRKQMDDGALCDVLLRPPVAGYTMVDLGRFDEIVARGYTEAVGHGKALLAMRASSEAEPSTP